MTSGKSEAPAGKGCGKWDHYNAFVDYTSRHLNHREQCVWHTLFRDVKPDGIAQTGQTDIARRTGLSVRSVKRAIKSLIGHKLLVVVVKGRLGRGASSYRVHGYSKSLGQGDTGDTL